MRPVAVTLAAGVLVLAACGSESRVQVMPPPRIPRPVATELAARSDALASALRRGDSCSADHEFHKLQRQAQAAVSSGSVPIVYRQRLLTAVTQLRAGVPNCVQPPPPPLPPPPTPPPAPPEKDKHGKHDHKHHGHGKGDGGD